MSTCIACGKAVYAVKFGSAGKIYVEPAPRVFSIEGNGELYVYAKILYVDHSCEGKRDAGTQR